MRRMIVGMAVLVLAAMTVSEVRADILEVVAVGNAGNANDTTGYGRVNYNYYIGKYEVTNAQYTAFLNGVAATDTHGLYNENMFSEYGCMIQRSGSSGGYTYDVTPDRANRPVNYVSFWDAARFVNWLHNGQGNGDTESGAYANIGNSITFTRQADAKYFIPTENEWYKAAYHKNNGVTGNYFDYPTGSDSVPSNVLFPPGLDPGNNANFVGYQNNYTIGSPYYVTEVGAFGNSESPYGTFDQGGNVFEWNETAIVSPFDNTENRGVRGGAAGYGSTRLLASSRNYRWPDTEIPEMGFRVASSLASVPEPSTLALWSLFGLIGGFVAWRKRKR